VRKHRQTADTPATRSSKWPDGGQSTARPAAGDTGAATNESAVVTADEVCAMLKISMVTLHKAVSSPDPQRRLPFFRITPRGKRLFRVIDVHAWLERQAMGGAE